MSLDILIQTPDWVSWTMRDRFGGDWTIERDNGQLHLFNNFLSSSGMGCINITVRSIAQMSEQVILKAHPQKIIKKVKTEPQIPRAQESQKPANTQSQP